MRILSAKPKASLTHRSPQKAVNRQHALLWLVLTLTILGLLSLAVFVLTRGQRSATEAQTTNFTFTEDFTTTTYQDPTATTADWNTALGEASLFQGFWTNLNPVIKGPQALPQGMTASGVFTSLVIGPTQEPHMSYRRSEGAAATIRFSRWDYSQQRWEEMNGNPGDTDLTAGLPSSDAFLRPENNLLLDSNGNPFVVFDKRHPVTSIFETWFTRWCPSLGGGAWGNAACSVVGPELVAAPGFHALVVTQAIDASNRPLILFADGAACGPPCN